jgi:hypothetical protein
MCKIKSFFARGILMSAKAAPIRNAEALTPIFTGVTRPTVGMGNMFIIVLWD